VQLWKKNLLTKAFTKADIFDDFVILSGSLLFEGGGKGTANILEV
jgi:hypothetical protein